MDDSAPEGFKNVEAFHAWLHDGLSGLSGPGYATDVVSKLPTTDQRILIHGDLRPQSIIVKRIEKGMDITLIDWGSSAVGAEPPPRAMVVLPPSRQVRAEWGGAHPSPVQVAAPPFPLFAQPAWLRPLDLMLYVLSSSLG
ncbi:hypothetical protein CALCODRAFT_487753 [Calocera cornea HHB12733]|uniref:Uncharacterized protein n=1 Tax=Calocera cornea HHB12733 TaxID=1353952 RepID=A0A165CY64_9BASI|nr:hypothetical protein CALCODRAFT_487753 [Calocera cornea HHB12733]